MNFSKNKTTLYYGPRHFQSDFEGATEKKMKKKVLQKAIGKSVTRARTS